MDEGEGGAATPEAERKRREAEEEAAASRDAREVLLAALAQGEYMDFPYLYLEHYSNMFFFFQFQPRASPTW